MLTTTKLGPGHPAGPLVRFRFRDVFLPDPDRVREQVDGDVELVGTLLELSDSGDRPGEFGVVSLAGQVHVVVPVTALIQVPTA